MDFQRGIVKRRVGAVTGTDLEVVLGDVCADA
jgi:hypothetical protein